MAAIALVTGANSGIGFEVVRALAQRGMTVYLGSRDPAKGGAAVAELASEGDVRLAVLDMTAPETFAPVLNAIAAEHGKLDVLVNNAGVALSGNALDTDQETVRTSFETNVHGPMQLTQMAVPLLRKSEDARIVNVSSEAGQLAFTSNPPEFVDKTILPYGYCLSKTALNAATVLFANALAADGIKVNACSPGLVKTQVSRFMGTRTPADGAKIIVELATSGEETGQFWSEDGKLDW